MKLFKNKKVVLASAIILGVSAITSSALAAYIITGGNRTVTKTVTPEGIDIDNRVVTLSAELTESTLNFEPVHAEGFDHGYVKCDGGDLSVTVNLEVVASKFDALGVTMLTVTDNSDASSKEYIVNPEATVLAATKGDTGQNYWTVKSTNSETNETTYTCSVVLTWTRGSFFGNSTDGPCAHYKEEKNSSKIVTEMEAFEKSIESTIFTITITMDEAASA